MTFKGFTERDFDVFSIDGLEPRMEAIIENVRPKLEELGNHFAPILTALTGDEMFHHVAKHARRTVNPPHDTWVALSANNRGYKKHPHFQIGLWGTHLFVWFAIINEAENKPEIAEILKAHQDDLLEKLPANFVWSTDHTKSHTVDTFDPEMLNHLGHVKKAEFLCGITLSRNQAISRQEKIVTDIEGVFKKLSPIYEWIIKGN